MFYTRKEAIKRVTHANIARHKPDSKPFFRQEKPRFLSEKPFFLPEKLLFLPEELLCRAAKLLCGAAKPLFLPEKHAHDQCRRSHAPWPANARHHPRLCTRFMKDFVAGRRFARPILLGSSRRSSHGFCPARASHCHPKRGQRLHPGCCSS